MLRSARKSFTVSTAVPALTARPIWGRVFAESGSLYPDTVCVVGHTPTNFLTGRDDEVFRIWHGVGSSTSTAAAAADISAPEHRRLACLRLDDMAEFYVGGSGREQSGLLPADNPEPPDEQDLPRRFSGIWTPTGKGWRSMCPIRTACGANCTTVATPLSGAERSRKPRHTICGRNIFFEINKVFSCSDGG